ncbi:protein C12orf45-like protein [Nibea albiflora]|uniref:Protein C12orf45-like protein n=1 Tax=Nibea albiflora TaxID=240163 RepID=A0ACB7EUI5_NIBAL|nr:protein C12orf45-like protein [Nibea albiflora]
MELNAKKTSSQALLSCGNGAGLGEKLLLKPKAGSSLQTERVPRSSVLDRLQSFLPQMADANEKLKQQMEGAPAGFFDIESVEEAQRVIEMDVALVELSGSDSDDEEDTSDSEDESDSGEDSEVTEQNLKLPGDKGKKKKANIQVVDQEGK